MMKIYLYRNELKLLTICIVLDEQSCQKDKFLMKRVVEYEDKNIFHQNLLLCNSYKTLV